MRQIEVEEMLEGDDMNKNECELKNKMRWKRRWSRKRVEEQVVVSEKDTPRVEDPGE